MQQQNFPRPHAIAASQFDSTELCACVGTYVYMYIYTYLYIHIIHVCTQSQRVVHNDCSSRTSSVLSQIPGKTIRMHEAVCVCVCVCVCLCVCVCICTYVNLYVCGHVYILYTCIQHHEEPCTTTAAAGPPSSSRDRGRPIRWNRIAECVCVCIHTHTVCVYTYTHTFSNSIPSIP